MSGTPARADHERPDATGGREGRDLERGLAAAAAAFDGAPDASPTHEHSIRLMDVAEERPDGNAAERATQGDRQHAAPERPPSISDLIGEFGLYQLSLATITLIRYVCVAMMTNTGPLLAPATAHWCQLPGALNSSHLAAAGNSSSRFDLLQLRNKCQLELANGTRYQCTKWTYDTSELGVTLTDSFDLVCERNWLRSAFQSCVSLGVVLASVLSGSFSDEHGRRLAMRLGALISLLAGLASCWAPNLLVYTLARALCSMSDLGLVGSLYTTIVETLGNKYRGTTCLIVFTGWSLGVMVMPWITDHYLDFRKVMLFTVACHVATLPWLLTVGESVRWLLVRGRLEEARREIERIRHWNSCLGVAWLRCNENNNNNNDDDDDDDSDDSDNCDNKGSSSLGASFKGARRRFEQNAARFELLKVKYELMARERERALLASGKQSEYNSRAQIVKRTLFGALTKVGEIFQSRELTITTAVMIWTTFNSELLYMLFIMINSDVGDNLKLNYAIGGLVETLATLLSIGMILALTRRLSLCATLITISASMLSLAFAHSNARLSVWALNLTKLAVSTLSSLVYVVVTELFPTSLRQTGIGLTSTLGSLGATVAPFIRTELVDLVGMTSVMLGLLVLPLSAALLIPFHLRETKGVELADDVNDL